MFESLGSAGRRCTGISAVPKWQDQVMPPESSPDRRAALLRRGIHLEWITIGWNTIEAGVAIAAGVVAHSIVLVAFGLDSAIEIFSATVTLGHLQGGADEARERRATRLVAGSLVALALYVTVESVLSFLTHSKPHTSTAGIVISAAALIVMPLLSAAKRRVGRALENPTLLVDSVETLLCAAFSGAALIGVSLNAAFGWWWADPVAALFIAAFALREGREAWSPDE